MKKITVLVGLYKADKFLEAKIENLRRQSAFDEMDVVLLNCQNLENEAEIYADFLKENENVSEILYEDHVGLYSTWNNGISQCNTEYVVNANVDDMWHPDYIKKMTNVLSLNKSYATAYSYVLQSGIPNQFDHETWQYKGGLSRQPFPGGTMGPCPVWRRSLHDKYGMFEDFQIISDAMMWQKWRRGGEKFLQVKEELVLYFNNPQSLERRHCPHSNLPLKKVELRKIGADRV